MPDRPVRFALVGHGLFGSHHARAIDQGSDTQLAAVVVRQPEQQAAVAAAYPEATIVADYREILDRDDIDVVDVVVPNWLHFEVASAALRAGKHVLLEKPMALNVAHCEQLVELASQQNLRLGINHELRLSSLWARVRKLIDEGRIGTPQHALIELSRFPYRQGSQGWRWDQDRVGSWILEEPIHFFDLARWYLQPAGEPVSIVARATSRHPERPELKDNFSAMVDFSGGGYALVSQTLSAFGHHQSAKIAGTEGTIWASWSAADARSDHSTSFLRYGLGDDVHEVELEKPAGELLELQDQIRVFARCTQDGSDPPCTGDDGRWATWLCLAAEQSVDSGQQVALQ